MRKVIRRGKSLSRKLFLAREDRLQCDFSSGITSGNVVSGLKSPSSYTYIPRAINKVRTVILVRKSIHLCIDLHFSSDDLTMVDVKDETLLLASCYMLHDDEAPLDE